MSRVVMVVDIDTTIANNDHRAKLLEQQCLQCLAKWEEDSKVCKTCGGTDSRVAQSNWDKFLNPVDTPVPKAQDVLYKMRELDMEFHFITGRKESLRPVTQDWLEEHFGWQPDREALIMRSQADDGLPASVYKERALDRLIKEKKLGNCKFIFMEDDPHVFRMYQQYGIVVKCPEGWDYFMPEPASSQESKMSR